MSQIAETLRNQPMLAPDDMESEVGDIVSRLPRSSEPAPVSSIPDYVEHQEGVT